MVRHATLAAVSASISMPVLPVTPVVVVTCMPTRPSSRSPACTGSHSTFAFVMLSGWHMGMSVLVCLAAMTPATRAHASTSPFAALPSTISASVSGCMLMKPSATATRLVISFSDTSTMRTSPFSSICVKCCCSVIFALLKMKPLERDFKTSGTPAKSVRVAVVRRIRLKQAGIGLRAMPAQLKSKPACHSQPQRRVNSPAGRPAKPISHLFDSCGVRCR